MASKFGRVLFLQVLLGYFLLFPGTTFADETENYSIVPISEPLDVGTRIHWDEDTQKAIFVDVPNSNVYTYENNTGEVRKAKVGDEPLAFMFPVEGSDIRFIAGLGRRLVYVDWDGKSPQVSNIYTIIDVDYDRDHKKNRFNGAKVDPWGRLWAGTMGPADDDGNTEPHKGSLYCLDKGVLTKHETNISISNGLAWNTKTKKMYYIDTLEPYVYQYDFSNDGKISNKTIVFDFKKQKISGLPDGLTIDTNGNLWVCAIHGSQLVKFNPNDGKVIEKIRFPTPQVTSVSYGGKNLDKLFVTTARIPVKGKVPPAPAGTTYVLYNAKVPGYAGDRYKPL